MLFEWSKKRTGRIGMLSNLFLLNFPFPEAQTTSYFIAIEAKNET